MKKIFICISLILFLFLLIYPFIEIDTGKKIIVFGYNEDVSKYEDVSCYDESYFYVEDKDISINNFTFSKFLFFHWIILDYEKGNVCETEYLLEEEYINNFLENAVILENENNIDLGKLIEGKKAIVSNKKYFGNDYKKSIYYKLDGKEEVMYIFYVDDLLVIQVGNTDEGCKFIAYR